MELIVTENFSESSRIAADIFEKAIAQKPDSLLGLATGSSVTEIYKKFAADCKCGRVDFSNCKSINVDEYMGISKVHPQSFAYFMHENLFEKTNFKSDNIYLVDGAGDEESETSHYNEFLASKRIDVLLLGVGANGHVGFNEPGNKLTASAHTVALSKETIEANARFFCSKDEVPKKAFTMGIRDIVKARKTVLIAFVNAKAQALKSLFEGDEVDPNLPCSVLKLCADATVIIDMQLAKAAGLR
ncbi:MAG: glucosamine-6-phosphate deaminase [Oscillospiraceae bacterium]